MTKFKNVLSEDDAIELLGSEEFSPVSINTDGSMCATYPPGIDIRNDMIGFVMAVEQAVRAKLHEQQEPVATVTVSRKTGVDIIWHQFQGLVDGTRLYAHPAPIDLNDIRKMFNISLSIDTQEAQALLQSHLDNLDERQR